MAKTLDIYSNGPDPEDDPVEVSMDLATLWNEAIASQTGFVPVAKHGQHDQKTHGRWAGKSRVPNKALEAIKTEGGFSMRMTSGLVPRSGFMVARGDKAAETDLGPVTDLKAKDIARYIDQNKKTLAQDGNYLGGWVDERGHVLMDISQRVMDRARATTLGRTRGQDAIFDLTNMEDIITKAIAGASKKGKPVRFLLDHTKDPEALAQEIRGYAREAGW